MKTNKKEKNTETKKIIIIICAVALTVVAAVIFFSFVLPALKANSLFRKQLSAFESMPSEDFILINDPYNSDQGVLPTTVDVVLSGSEAQQLAEELTSIIENAKFLERDQSIHGFWDISVSLRQYGGSNMIYLCEDTVYVVKNDTRYIFGFEAASPEKKLYSEFYRNIKDMLAEQANKNNNN